MRETTGTKEAEKDQRLLCRVEGDRLVISIGISTLAWAARHSEGVRQMFRDEEGDPVDEVTEEMFRATDERVFATEIKRALTDEAEDGSSPLTNLLDKATMDAIDDGCEGLYIKGILDDED